MPELPTARFKHFANIGDIIAVMVSLKSYHEQTKRKVILSQQLNVPADYYEGATHPTRDAAGVQVMCNKKMWEMVRPLILSQPYIHDFEEFSGQLVNVDLDRLRKEIFVNMPNQAIQQWAFMAFPDLATDLSKPWIHIDEVDITECGLQHTNLVTTLLPIENIWDKVILNFTQRYRNAGINYYFLQKYIGNLIFAGTEEEHYIFCDQWKLDIPRLIVKDFLQLAFIIKNCKFLFSNQSFCWNVAEAMKTPRLLEICQYAPNCQAFIGEKSLGFLHQKGAQHYFNILFK